MSHAREIALLVVAAIGIVQAVPVFAQAYPTRAIRMVVGFPPGGFTDILARQIGDRLAPTTWFGVFAPAGTPREVIERWSSALRGLLAQADFAERIVSLGGQLAKPNTSEEFAAFIEREIERWGKIVRAANVRLE